MDLLSQIYQSGFVASSLALLLWNGLPKRVEIASFAPVLIIGGLVAMLGGLVGLEGPADEKLFIFARDLVVQAALAVLIRWLSQKPKLLFPAILLVGAIYYVFYRDVQTESLMVFRQESASTRVLTAGAAEETSGILGGGRLDATSEYLVYADREQLQQVDGVLSVVPAFNGLEKTPAGRRLQQVVAVDVQTQSFPQRAEELRKQLEALGPLEENEVITISPVRDQVQPGAQLKGPKPEDIGLNDPLVSEQWALSAWSYGAFAKTTQSRVKQLQPARLFILDSGIDAAHEDLETVYESHEESHDRDALGHGTHVAGIAAAAANNGKGIAGWFPKNQNVLTVSSIRVIGPFGVATQRSVVQGIIDAANAGAAVINLSLGGPSTDRKQKIYADAVAYAEERGAIVVVAAGNSAMDARRYAPANTPGVIAVAALDNQLQQATFSNSISGLEMGVWAPGKDIYSTIPNQGYTTFSGTSMAAPQVAGLLTLAKALKPALTSREAYRLIKSSVRGSAATQDSPEVLDASRFIEGL